MDINQDAVKTLNDFLEISRDGEFVFRECATYLQAAVALKHYRKASTHSLPDAADALVRQQASGAQRKHDQFKALGDALQAAG